MSCTKCNCKTAPCSCEDQGLTTPPPCSVDTNFCPAPSPCSEQFDSQCIVYNGDGNTCAGIESGMSMQEVVDTLTTALNPFLCLQCPSVFLPTSGTVDVSLTPTLTWNSVTGATGYDVYLDTVNPPLHLALSNTSETSYTVPLALDETTTYYWQIVSRNGAGPAKSCPIEQFTTLTVPVPACTNPVQYILDIAIKAAPTQTYADVLASITSTLNSGVIINECNLCCPDCPAGPYVLGTTVNFINVYDYLGPQATWKCCLNVDSSLQAYGTFLTATSATTWTKCCTSFSDCTTSISKAITDYPSLLTEGILEYGTIADDTTLCIILDTLQALTPSLTPTELGNLIQEILDLGIVVQCNGVGVDTQILISSINSYVTYNPFQ